MVTCWSNLRGSGGEPLDQRPLVGAEPRRLSGSRILPHTLGLRGCGNRDGAARVAEHPLQQRLPPRLDAELAQRLELASRRHAAHQGPLAERAHDEHAEAELLREREDRPLHVTLAWV